MAKRFEGQVALITGGASGIGLATALRFAEEGATVSLADLDAERGAAAVEQIRARGGRGVFQRTDVTKSADVKSLIDATVEAFGGLDIAFNNAGVGGANGVGTADIEEDDWARIIAINLTSVWLCMKYELRHMAERGRGRIVNTSSTAGLYSAVNSGAAYAASKHGVVGLTKTAAKEYSGRNIRVNAICPAGVATPLFRNTVGEKRYSEATAAGMVATPEMIAGTVAWLCSDDAEFVTGQAVLIDNARFA